MGGASPSFLDLYELVVKPEYDVVNNLRLYTHIFSGFQLTSSSYASQKNTPILYQIPADFDARIEKLETKQWAIRYTALTSYIPNEIVAKPLKILGEIGWDVDGYSVNHDTCHYQEQLNLLYESGIINWLRRKIDVSGSINILEIGGGYGGLAYYLKKIFHEANYYICDIPESMLFSSLYLGIASPEYKCTIYDGNEKPVLSESDSGYKIIANYMFDDLASADIKMDLAINISSFSEMSEKQVRYYAQNLSHMLSDTGVLFERNYDHRHRGGNYCKLYLPEYFRYRRAIKSLCLAGASAETDIWANTRISNLGVRKGHILRSLRILRTKWWLLWVAQGIIGKTRFAQFIYCKPRIKSFVLRIFRVQR